MNTKVSVIGSGSWGTALAKVLSDNGHNVCIWARRQDVVDEINNHHTNTKYLQNVKLPTNIFASTSLESVIKDSSLVIYVVPSHTMREVVKESSKYINDSTLLVHASKGFEEATNKRMSNVIKEELGDQYSQKISVLSGPSHAEEVVKELPTTVVVSSKNVNYALEVQNYFNNNYFRVYTNKDLVGVELGGSLKNIIALAAGLSDGLGYGDNTKAALITRGLAEISRLGECMGASPMTFLGLSGVGDLMVTCASKHSRNWNAGFKLGTGESVDEVIKGSGMVVEGIKATRVTKHLSDVLNVDMPITNALYDVLFNQAEPLKATNNLMNRLSKNE